MRDHIPNIFILGHRCICTLRGRISRNFTNCQVTALHNKYFGQDITLQVSIFVYKKLDILWYPSVL